MNIDINSITLEIPCPHCAHKISKTVRQLKSLTNLTCSACGTVSATDKAQVAREITRVQRGLESHHLYFVHS